MWFLTTWNTSIVDASEICTKPTPCTASARASSNCSRTWLSETQKHCSTVFRGRTSSAHRLRKKKHKHCKKKIAVGSRVTFFPTFVTNYWKFVPMSLMIDFLLHWTLVVPRNHPGISNPMDPGPPTRRRRANSWRSGLLYGGGTTDWSCWFSLRKDLKKSKWKCHLFFLS